MGRERGKGGEGFCRTYRNTAATALSKDKTSLATFRVNCNEVLISQVLEK